MQEILEQRDQAFRELFRVRKTLKSRIKKLEEEKASLHYALTEGPQAKMNRSLHTELERVVKEKDVTRSALKRSEAKRMNQKQLLEKYFQKFKELKAEARTKLKDKKGKMSSLKQKIRNLKAWLRSLKDSASDDFSAEICTVFKTANCTNIEPSKHFTQKESNISHFGQRPKSDEMNGKRTYQVDSREEIGGNRGLVNVAQTKCITSDKLTRAKYDSNRVHRCEKVEMLVEKIISDEFEVQTKDESLYKEVINNQNLSSVVPSYGLVPSKQQKDSPTTTRSHSQGNHSIKENGNESNFPGHVNLRNDQDKNTVAVNRCKPIGPSLQYTAESYQRKPFRLNPKQSLSSDICSSNDQLHEVLTERRQTDRLKDLEKRECEKENEILTTDLINARLQVALLREENVQLRNAVCKLKSESQRKEG